MKKKDTGSLLPKWLPSALTALAPLLVLGAAYAILTAALQLSLAISLGVGAVAAVAPLIYFGGRFYKRSYIGADKRCTAKDFRQRANCRHFIPGASLGNGCGRLREDGKCRFAIS